jgi:crotonobetainyl-CoA:carnitine CoA-transferase CaiB-like acyl-CoA transferase
VADHAANPLLQANGYWQLLPHDRYGVDLVPALPFIADGERLGDSRAVPSLGADTRSILRDVGYADAAIDALVASGAVAEMEPAPAFPREPRPFLRARPRPLGLDDER